MADRVKPRQPSPGARTEIWDELWQQKTTPWDRFEPHPALIDALNEKTKILGTATEDGDETLRKKALIPGCGRGYDVLLFASHGYDAFGLDISQTAVDACQELDKEQGDDAIRYPLRDVTVGRGSRHFLAADFFVDDLSSHTSGGGFDIIYDHTFLCALPPELRPQWSKRMSELLAPNGSLICLEFPLAKPPNEGGPPHGLSSELYVQLFKEPGRDVRYAENGQVAPEDRSLDHPAGLLRVAHWSPARQPPGGNGTDMISIWKHGGSV
jgi:SAM-dependent methyltransferase